MEKIIYTGDDRTTHQVCSHCRMCELICSFTRFGQVNPKRSKIRIIRTKLDDAVPVTCLLSIRKRIEPTVPYWYIIQPSPPVFRTRKIKV